MFTGIVEETGRVESIEASANSIRLIVRAHICGRGLNQGDSLAVNGCCLTAVKVRSKSSAKLIQFDLLKETWQRTNLSFVRPGSSVNLERALRASDRLGGHFVTGHIDGTGEIILWERRGADWILEITAPRDIRRYLVFKGSIAVDGISLTIADVRQGSFIVWIIPHTYEVTALRERAIGDFVNLEADLLGKYVERLLGGRVRA